MDISEKERQLLAKCLEDLASKMNTDVLGLFLKKTKWDEFDDDELCDLVHKLTQVYPYRGM